MNIDELIEIVKDKTLKFDTKFFSGVVKRLSKLKKSESGKIIDTIYEIKSDAYLLEAVKLLLIKKFHTYRFYLSSTKPGDNIIYRTITLSENARLNLFRQINVLDNNDVSLFVSSDHMRTYQYVNVDKFYLIVCDIDEIDTKNMIQIKSMLVLVLFLGIETFRFLEHQNMNRFLEFFISDVQAHQLAISNFKKLFEFSLGIDPDIRDRIVIFSGMTLQALGTGYTDDVDIIYYSQKDSKDNIKHVTRFSKNNGDLFDFKIYDDRSDNIDNTKEIMVDPEQYFYFIGMKFMSVSQLLQRCYMRSTPAAYVDLLLLNKFNAYDVDLCLPAIVTIYDKPFIYDRSGRKNMVDQIVEKMNRWFKIKLDSLKIESVINICDNYGHDSMIINPGKDAFTHYIGKFLLFASKELIYKYLDGDSVLEIDTNRSRNILLYPRVGIKNITIIEESQYILDRIDKLIRNNTQELKDVKFDIFKGYDNKKPFTDRVYDNIILRNVLDKIDDTERYLQKLSLTTKRDTMIIVICMDGERVKKLLASKDRHEIYVSSQLKFGIYNFEKYNNDKIIDPFSVNLPHVAIYMKQLFGYDKGSVQRFIIIDDLINIFTKLEYDLILSSHLDDLKGTEIFEDIKSEMTNRQRSICRLFTALVFKKR